MMDIKEDIKKLYKDALYWRLIGNGYAIRRAELEAENISKNYSI